MHLGLLFCRLRAFDVPFFHQAAVLGSVDFHDDAMDWFYLFLFIFVLGFISLTTSYLYVGVDICPDNILLCCEDFCMSSEYKCLFKSCRFLDIIQQ